MPTQRSRRIDWSIMPMTGRPRCARAIRVPNSGRPVMNDLVPSIGIEHPDELGVDPVAAMLLAQDAVVRVGRRDQLAHGGLGLLVGDGHRAGVGLGLDRDRRAEVAALDLARTIRQPVGQRLERPVVGAGHRDGAGQLPGSGAGSAASERR